MDHHIYPCISPDALIPLSTPVMTMKKCVGLIYCQTIYPVPEWPVTPATNKAKFTYPTPAVLPKVSQWQTFTQGKDSGVKKNNITHFIYYPLVRHCAQEIGARGLGLKAKKVTSGQGGCFPDLVNLFSVKEGYFADLALFLTRYLVRMSRRTKG